MKFLTIPGWYRGFSTKNRAVKGIFPSSYVHLKPCKIDNEGLFESVIPLEDPVVREVTLVLREWGGIWKRLYVVSTSYSVFLSARLPLFFLIAKSVFVYFREYLLLLKLRSMKKKLQSFNTVFLIHFFASVFENVYVIYTYMNILIKVL